MTATDLTRRVATRAAMEVRAAHKVGRDSPVCVLDLAARMGIQVWFKPQASLEGLYVRGGTPVVILGSLRSAGRQAFTLSHELGHHKFNHGTRVDEYVTDHHRMDRSDPDEQIANTFAGMLLMPPSVVRHSFQTRGWQATRPTPEQMFTIAAYLGVSYQALVGHMRLSLKLLDNGRADELMEHSPRSVRARLLGRPTAGHVVVADAAWDSGALAIDLRVGDHLLLPARSRVEGCAICHGGDHGEQSAFEGVHPGIAKVETADATWAAYVRVMPQAFDGPALDRHEEEG